MSEEKKELGEPQRIMRSPAPERVDRPAVRIKDSVDEADFKAIIDVAKEKGVVEGIAIKARDIVTNSLMPMKCRIPTCWGYNSSYFCPPRTISTSDMQAIIDDFEWALLLHIPPPEPSAPYSDFYGHMNTMKEIIGRTEVEAQYKGYVNSMGFTGGPCTICGMFSPEWVAAKKAKKDAPLCTLITGEFSTCLQYYHCRPSVQAVGIDMYATAKGAGWEDRLALPLPVKKGRTDWPCLPGVYPILVM
jgi:predicted metal-binding protein